MKWFSNWYYEAYRKWKENIFCPLLYTYTYVYAYSLWIITLRISIDVYSQKLWIKFIKFIYLPEFLLEWKCSFLLFILTCPVVTLEVFKGEYEHKRAYKMVSETRWKMKYLQINFFYFVGSISVQPFDLCRYMFCIW